MSRLPVLGTLGDHLERPDRCREKMTVWSSLADVLDPPLANDGQPKVGHSPFYCYRPTCDGTAHDGFDYPHARAPQQNPPDLQMPDWFIWLFLAGRGSGKTRTGSEWMVDQMLENPPGCYFGVLGPTVDDTRDICIEGESGILAVLERRGFKRETHYRWNRTLGHLDLLAPWNQHLETFTDVKPDGVRGPNLTAAWIDEPATFVNGMRKGSNPGSFDNLLMCLRKGNPKLFISGTPKATKFVKHLIKEADHQTKGSSHDNRANLADAWFKRVISPLEGTAMGKQEIEGELLEQATGALWQQEWLRERPIPTGNPTMVRIGHDPAVTNQEGSDLHGIVAVAKYRDGSLQVLQDLSGVMSGRQAALKAVEMATLYGGTIHYEGNQGGTVWEELYEAASKELGIRQPRAIRYTSVKSKEGRAQPVAQISESAHAGLVQNPPVQRPTIWFTLDAPLEELRLELTTWVPKESKDSPDRLDAFVIAVIAMLEDVGTSSAGMSKATSRSAGSGRPQTGGSYASAARAGRAATRTARSRTT